MSMLRSTWLFLLVLLVMAGPLGAQETAAPEAAADEPAPISDAIADEATPLAEEPPADGPPTKEPVAEEPVAEEPPATGASSEEVAEEPAEEPAVEAETTPVEVAEEEVDGEAVTEEPEDAATDWAGLIDRAPVFFSVTHHAVIHLPIALWLFGAFFVVVGVVIPSLKNQIPLACLIGGAITSVPAVLSGWWYADHEWGDDWREIDWASIRENGWDEFELIAQHRWLGVALIFASFLLSIIAIIAYRRQSLLLGFIWRVGLIGLALAVAWEGHIGGELIQGEGFLEEAFELWLHPE